MTSCPSSFPSTPEGLHEISVLETRPINPLTGLPDHDDSGYSNPDKMRVEECGEPLVALPEDHSGIVLRPSYEGASEVDGTVDSRMRVPGGVAEQGMFVRASFARQILNVADYVQSRYGSTVQLGILDTWRSRERQSALFGRSFKEAASTPVADLPAFYEAALRADGTSSWVRPSKETEQDRGFLTQALGDLRGSAVFKEIKELAEAKGRSVDAVLMELVTATANLTSADKSWGSSVWKPFSCKLPLSSHVMGHSTGGCGDIYLLVDGKPVNLEPFDLVGPEAAIETYEDGPGQSEGTAFEAFQRAARSDLRIRSYLSRLGVDPDNIPWERFLLARDGIRILTHAFLRAGCTYYSAADRTEGGEKWHINGSNALQSIPQPGLVIARGPLYEAYPNSGSACQARLRVPFGSDGKQVAIYGGHFAHQWFGATM